MASSDFVLAYGMLLIASWINSPLFTYENDSVVNRAAVSLSFLVDAMAMGSVMVTTWYYLVSCWGDVISLARPPLSVPVYMMGTALSAVISQSFLTRRIFLLTKQLVWPIALGLFIITGLGSALGASILVAGMDHPAYSENMMWTINFWFCSSAVTDLSITIMMIYALRSLKRRTNSAHIPASPPTTHSTPALSNRSTPSPRSFFFPTKPSCVFSAFRQKTKPACQCAPCTSVDPSNAATSAPNHSGGIEDIAHMNGTISPIGGSERLIERLSVRAAQTGICTAVIAVAACICFNTMKNNLATMLGMLLGRIHVITILYNLNSRRPTSNSTGSTQCSRDVYLMRNDISVQPSELNSRNPPRSFGMDQGMPSGRSGRPSRDCLIDDDELDFGLCIERRRGSAPDASFLQITPPSSHRRASDSYLMYHPSLSNFSFDADRSFRPSYNRSISAGSTIVNSSPGEMSGKQLRFECSPDTIRIMNIDDQTSKP
ncbi:hypothetical protein [Phaffia rhodozyma]|uniref:DUF6534 domain-containing protein n=1 Tax=Phaffia rhodozyma TaxID=264483 RepID=A0A0F7SMF6_PHARH|nr:hypothetical protein [Phaffia rhodozyma]